MRKRMDKKLGIKIRQLRELKGFSQEYMAQRLSISQRAFSKIERQEVPLDWNRIADIAAIFEMDPIDLITFDDNLIFNQLSQKAESGSVYSNLPSKLIEQYEKRIQTLEEEVRFLRSLLEKK